MLILKAKLLPQINKQKEKEMKIFQLFYIEIVTVQCCFRITPPRLAQISMEFQCIQVYGTQENTIKINSSIRLYVYLV